MYPDSAQVAELPLPEIARTRLRLVGAKYPTVGDVRRALDRDLITLPGISRGTVRKLREALGSSSRVHELEAALTAIRDLLPIEQDEYSRRVFAIASEALEPSL